MISNQFGFMPGKLTMGVINLCDKIGRELRSTEKRIKCYGIYRLEELL